MDPRVAIFISGRGSNMNALLEAEKQSRLKGRIEVIISNNPDAQGLDVAHYYHKKTYVFRHENYKSREEHEKAIIRILKKHEITHIVLAGYMRIISEVLINKYPNKIINIHPSLLPAFPGLHAQKKALDYGVRVAGCTVHLVTKDVDAGPILVQKTVPVYSNDTEETLSARILEQEHIAIVEATNLLLEGKFRIKGRRVIFEEDE